MINLIIGSTYKWKHSPETLIYVGKNKGWNQFTLNGAIWCEVLDSDLYLMENCYE